MNEILVIDDDRFLLESVSRLLVKESFSVRVSPNASDGYREISDKQPDLLILDLSLPDEDGFALCRRIRTSWKFPILMLTSRSEMLEKVIGLEVGADDYLTKPFEGRELVARIRAHLRRVSHYTNMSMTHAVIEASGLCIDETARTATAGGEEIGLTELEFRLLLYMAKNAGRALGRDQLFESVWGYDEEFNSNSLEVIVYRLRSKLEKPLGRKIIHTVRGFGYKLTLS